MKSYVGYYLISSCKLRLISILLPEILKLVGLPIFGLSEYLMKVIPETHPVH